MSHQGGPRKQREPYDEEAEHYQLPRRGQTNSRGYNTSRECYNLRSRSNSRGYEEPREYVNREDRTNSSKGQTLGGYKTKHSSFQNSYEGDTWDAPRHGMNKECEKMRTPSGKAFKAQDSYHIPRGTECKTPSMQRVQGESPKEDVVVNFNRDLDTIPKDILFTFYTKCYVQSEVCTLIVDEKCYTNLVSTSMVKRLGLPTFTHPKPYTLQSLNGSMKVCKRVMVPLSIGRYVDEIPCDVVPMSIAHVLLGLSWGVETRATCDLYMTRYSFVKHGQKFTMSSYFPFQIFEEQLLMREKEREKRKEIVSKNVEEKSDELTTKQESTLSEKHERICEEKCESKRQKESLSDIQKESLCEKKELEWPSENSEVKSEEKKSEDNKNESEKTLLVPLYNEVYRTNLILSFLVF